MTVLYVLSDVHVEFHRDGGREFVHSLDPQGVDILVLAGDIASFPTLGTAIDLFCERFPNVVYVPGNHEYYHSSPPEVHGLLDERRRRHANFHWLDESVVVIRETRFVGTTMWFEDTPESARYRMWMNDFRNIDGFVPWVFEKNSRSLEFLQREVRTGDVVVTHHLPSNRSVPEQFADSPLNPFFVCDVEALITEREPALWIHGHTHHHMDYALASTRVVANPYGYVGYENHEGFDPTLRITLA